MVSMGDIAFYTGSETAEIGSGDNNTKAGKTVLVKKDFIDYRAHIKPPRAGAREET
ncbi:hypothetical protein D3C81_1886000 [compost metagenome]